MPFLAAIHAGGFEDRFKAARRGNSERRCIRLRHVEEQRPSGRPCSERVEQTFCRGGVVREQGTDLDAAPAGPCDAISLQSAVIRHTQRNVGFRSEPGVQEVRPYATEMRPVVEGDGGRVFRPEIRDAGSGSRRRDIFATVETDLAVTPLPSSLVADGFEKLGPQDGLSRIGDYQLKLEKAATIGSAGKAFSQHVELSFGEMQTP